MITRKFIPALLLQLLLGCTAGTVSTKKYSDLDLSKVSSFAWQGLTAVNTGNRKSGDLGLTEAVEQQLQDILKKRGIIEAPSSKAPIFISLNLQLENALEVEKQYRKRVGGIYGSGEQQLYHSAGGVLLPDTDTPLYGGQQRGAVSLTVFNAATKEKVKTSFATVIFPDDLNNTDQMKHLNQMLRKLVYKTFGKL